MEERSDRSDPNGRLRIAAIGLRGIPSHYSGLETSARFLYQSLARRGHDITVYCRPQYLDDMGIGEYHGIRRLRLPSLRFKSTETVSHIGLSLAHALACGSYDLLHTHALAPGFFSWMRRFSEIPIVATIQGLDWQRSKWNGAGSRVLRRAERCLARYADELIVVSRDLQHYFQRQYRRFPEYIPNGIDRLATPAEDRASDALASFGLHRKRYVVFVGRLVPEKRIHELIVAFRQMPAQFRLAIVGEGGYTQHYVDHLRQLAATDPRVVFTGLLKGPSLASVFSQAAAFVSPSEIEGLPMALLESMELGVPAVVSNIPPHRELLGSVAGYDLFFPLGDVNQLGSCLDRVLSAPRWSRRLALSAQQMVRLHYAWPEIAERTEQVFHRAMTRKQGSTSPEPGGR